MNCTNEAVLSEFAVQVLEDGVQDCAIGRGDEGAALLAAFYALTDLDRLTVDVRDQGRGVDVRGVVDPCKGAGLWD